MPDAGQRLTSKCGVGLVLGGQTQGSVTPLHSPTLAAGSMRRQKAGPHSEDFTTLNPINNFNTTFVIIIIFQKSSNIQKCVYNEGTEFFIEKEIKIPFIQV